MADITYSPGDAPISGAPRQLSTANLLTMLGRYLPPSYLDPLKSPGPGYELLQALAAALSRVSLAVGRSESGLYILTAPSAVKAAGTVQLYRASATAGAVIVLKGAMVATSEGGRDFILTADAAFGALDLGPVSAAVEAIGPGWEWNVTGQRTTAAGEVAPGEIDTIKLPLQDPPYGDPTILVRQVTDMTGGQPAMLDQLGEDRGITRHAGEADTQYRARVRALPNGISPDAIMRALIDVLAPMGLTFTAIETWSVEYQTCYDAPDGTIPGSAYDPNLFCLDDPRDPMPFRNRLLDDEEAAGTFIIVLPNVPAMMDVSMALDDTAVTPADLTTSLGDRAASAYDVPDSATSVILQGGLDGFDPVKLALYKGIWQMLQLLKAAGITAIVELEGE